MQNFQSNNGLIITDIAPGQDYVKFLAINSNGFLFAIGSSQNAYGGASTILVKYLPDGSVDTSFGKQGFLNLDNFGGSEVDLVSGLNGDIYVAISNTWNSKIYRISQSGSIDTKFSDLANASLTKLAGINSISFNKGQLVVAGYNGKILILKNNGENSDFLQKSIFPENTIFSAITLPDGKILATGREVLSYGQGDAVSIICYKQDGELDLSFGNAGRTSVNLSPTNKYFRGSDFGFQIQLTSESKILVTASSSFNPALIRLNANGSIDTSFGSNGFVVDHTKGYGSGPTGEPDVQGYILVSGIQPDGDIILTGNSLNNASWLRYSSNGVLIQSYLELTNLTVGNDLIVQGDGSFLIGGGSLSSFGVQKYSELGNKDTSSILVPTLSYTRFIGSSSADTLIGDSEPNIFIANFGNDLITGLGGDDQIDGGSGIDTAVYINKQDNFSISIAAGVISIRDITGAEGADSLVNVERIKFNDMSLAFDLSGSAGTTAKILGAVFGKDLVNNKNYVGIGLHFLDAGWTYDNLAALALDAAGAKTNDQIVSLLWSNVIGSKPTAADKQPFIALLEKGMTAGALAHLAADSSFNTTNINLVGLEQTGIEYIPVS